MSDLFGVCRATILEQPSTGCKVLLLHDVHGLEKTANRETKHVFRFTTEMLRTFRNRAQTIALHVEGDLNYPYCNMPPDGADDAQEQKHTEGFDTIDCFREFCCDLQNINDANVVAVLSDARKSVGAVPPEILQSLITEDGDTPTETELHLRNKVMSNMLRSVYFLANLKTSSKGLPVYSKREFPLYVRDWHTRAPKLFETFREECKNFAFRHQATDVRCSCQFNTIASQYVNLMARVMDLHTMTTLLELCTRKVAPVRHHIVFAGHIHVRNIILTLVNDHDFRVVQQFSSQALLLSCLPPDSELRHLVDVPDDHYPPWQLTDDNELRYHLVPFLTLEGALKPITEFFEI